MLCEKETGWGLTGILHILRHFQTDGHFGVVQFNPVCMGSSVYFPSTEFTAKQTSYIL